MAITAAKFVFPSSRRCEHLCICVLICPKGNSSLNKPSMCVISLPHSRCVVSYWMFVVVSLLGDSHIRAVFCPPHVLYTSLGHEPPRLCTAPEGIKGVPSYQREKQDPKMRCHLDRNSDPLSSLLSLTSPILLTNDSGLCHFIFYMWTFSLTPPATDHSGSKPVS